MVWELLLFAAKEGVQILAYDTIVKEDELILDKAIPVNLSLTCP